MKLPFLYIIERGVNILCHNILTPTPLKRNVNQGIVLYVILNVLCDEAKLTLYSIIKILFLNIWWCEGGWGGGGQYIIP